MEPPADVGAETVRAEQELKQAAHELKQAEAELQDAEDQPVAVSWRDVLLGLRWKRILLVAAGIFVAAMLVILTFELIAGRAVSTYTGGTEDGGARTSIPGMGGNDNGTDRDEQPAPTQAPDTEPSEDLPPTPAPTEAPSSEPPDEAPTTSEPTDEPTPTDPVSEPPAE